MTKSKSGFTIVELLIVIVVIAILAAISVVAYNGISERAEDTKLRSVAHQFAKAFQLWAVQSGKTTSPGGSGSTEYRDGVCVGGGGGWISRNTSYACTIDRILVDSGFIPAELTQSVPVSKNAHANAHYASLMMYGCPTAATTKRYVVMYSLNNPDPSEISKIRTTCQTGTTYGPIDDYKMNGGFIIELSS